MNLFRLVALIFACVLASSRAADASPKWIEARVRVVVMNHVPLSAVILSCGSFAGDGPGRGGVTPLTHVIQRGLVANPQLLQIGIPIAPNASYFGCWPSVDSPYSLDMTRTIRMVWHQVPVSNTPGIITLGKISVYGPGP